MSKKSLFKQYEKTFRLSLSFEGESKSRRSVTNVGMRPTFNGASLSVETHLLDFSGEVTAKRMEVRFWKRLREEKKFAGPEDLRAQIARDIAAARRFFARLRRFRSLRNAPVPARTLSPT